LLINMIHLRITEKLMLLSLDDEKGRVIDSASTILNHALVGAAMMELAELGYFKMLEDQKLELIKSEEPESAAQQLLFERLQKFKRPKSLKGTISNLAFSASLISKIRRCVISDLLEKGILREEEKKILWIFNHTNFPETDGKAEKAVRKDLREVIAGNKTPDHQEVILLGLIKACHLMKEVFPEKEERKIAKAGIDGILEQHQYAKELSDSIKKMEEEIMVALMVVTA